MLLWYLTKIPFPRLNITTLSYTECPLKKTLSEFIRKNIFRISFHPKLLTMISKTKNHTQLWYKTKNITEQRVLLKMKIFVNIQNKILGEFSEIFFITFWPQFLSDEAALNDNYSVQLYTFFFLRAKLNFLENSFNRSFQ